MVIPYMWKKFVFMAFCCNYLSFWETDMADVLFLWYFVADLFMFLSKKYGACLVKCFDLSSTWYSLLFSVWGEEEGQFIRNGNEWSEKQSHIISPSLVSMGMSESYIFGVRSRVTSYHQVSSLCEWVRVIYLEWEADSHHTTKSHLYVNEWELPIWSKKEKHIISPSQWESMHQLLRLLWLKTMPSNSVWMHQSISFISIYTPVLYIIRRFCCFNYSNSYSKTFVNKLEQLLQP